MKKLNLLILSFIFSTAYSAAEEELDICKYTFKLEDIKGETFPKETMFNNSEEDRISVYKTLEDWVEPEDFIPVDDSISLFLSERNFRNEERIQILRNARDIDKLRGFCKKRFKRVSPKSIYDKKLDVFYTKGISHYGNGVATKVKQLIKDKGLTHIIVPEREACYRDTSGIEKEIVLIENCENHILTKKEAIKAYKDNPQSFNKAVEDYAKLVVEINIMNDEGSDNKAKGFKGECNKIAYFLCGSAPEIGTPMLDFDKVKIKKCKNDLGNIEYKFVLQNLNSAKETNLKDVKHLINVFPFEKHKRLIIEAAGDPARYKI